MPEEDDTSTDTLQVEVTGLVADEGTVMVFCGQLGDATVHFGVDHHCGAELATALTFDMNVLAAVEPWQILSSS